MTTPSPTTTTVNRSHVRANVDLERVAYNIVRTHPHLSRVYGMFNVCFTCKTKTLTGFMDLDRALYDHARTDVQTLAPHLAYPDPDATIRFREALEEHRIPTWKTRTIDEAQLHRADITRVVHEHNHVQRHFPLVPPLVPTATPDPMIASPAYYWTDPTRGEGVTDREALDVIKRENDSVMNGFLRPRTVSDVLRAVPRTAQFDFDLLLVDGSTGLPVAVVEHANVVHSTATGIATGSLSRTLDVPLLYIQWTDITHDDDVRRHTVYRTFYVNGEQVPGGSEHSDGDLSQTAFDILDDWIVNRTPR